MKLTPVVFLLAYITLLSNTAKAQYDSLYTQQWNRDPVMSLSHTSSTQRQIITSKQIEASGYTRISDLIQLVDGWNFTTITGDQWAIQSNATGSFNHQNWIVMLNGQRIELSLGVTIDLNMLGVSVADIERIEIVNAPGMYLGEFNQNGLIHIVTKKLSQKGVALRTYYGQQLNTSDQARLSKSAENPQFGYTVNQLVGFRKNNFQVIASAGAVHSTNADSITGLYKKTPFNTKVEALYSGKRVSHQIQAGLSSISNLNSSNASRIGYLGLWDITPSQQFRLSSTYNYVQDNLEKTSYVSNTLQHRFLKRYKTGNFIWQNGVGLDYIKTAATTLPSALASSGIINSSNLIVKPYTSVNIPANRKINLFADVQVAFLNKKTAPKLSVGLYKRMSLISNYSFVFSYNEYLSEEYQLNRVNRIISATGRTFYYYNPKQISADFYYNLNFGNSVKISFNSAVKNTFDLPDYRYEENPVFANYGFSYITRSTHYLNWLNRFNLHYDILKNILFDINYTYTNPLSTWNEELMNLPKHKLMLTLQYEFPGQYSLWTRNYWQSQTKWYNDLHIYPSDPFYVSLPSVYTWDLGVSKKLYKDHLNLNVTARNLFNSTERYHPLGAQSDIRFCAGITANIDGLFASRTTKP